MLFILIFLVLAGLTWLAWRKPAARPSKATSDSDSYRDEDAAETVDQVVGMARPILRIVWPVLLTLWVIWNVVLVVPVGTVKIATLFGTVQDQTYDQGLHVVNPLLSMHGMSVQRKIAEFQSTNGDKNSDDVVAVSSDNLPLTVDVTYAYRMNPTYASWLYRNIGDENTFTSQLVVQAARSATRSATAQFDYAQATTSQRDALARAMEAEFRQRLVDDMVRQGLSRDHAQRVFTILPVQLRKVLPPEKVQNAIAEKISSEQDLQRQKILTDIATQEALRRGQEGLGVKKLFDQLPVGFNANQIAEIMSALANKERADAQLKAVESGKVTVMVMDGTPAVTVPK